MKLTKRLYKVGEYSFPVVPKHWLSRNENRREVEIKVGRECIVITTRQAQAGGT
jgi:hypothetical protein